jgi:serine/threonine-protein kinase
MTEPSDLDSHLDRLMESAYDALTQRAEERQRRADVRPPEPDLPAAIGPYPVSGLLGRGGTSYVYRGRDPELGRDLAIKVIDQRYEPDSALGKRFLDEARICSQLSHPGIVPIHAIGQLEDGRPYFTMRLVEGQTFGALLDARANPDDRLQQCLEIFARVVETIAFAHARGVVHGDLKPGNVMVGAFGQVQVMDWGFSRVLDDAAGGTSGRGMGTPAFMAPEQAGNGVLDPRADVFGLGAILCVVLTGAPPFLGGSRSEIHVRAAQGCLGDALLRLRVCGADAELVQLAVHCLASTPEERPAAEQVAARLSAWFVSIEERARRLELAAAQAKVVAVEHRRTRRRSIALGVLAAVFAAVYAWMRFERQARDYDARVAVVQAIERARNLRAGADIAGSERIRLLGEAAVAAQHATTFASTLDDAALRDEAARLAKRLAEDRDAAVRDERMLRWLDDFPSHLDRTSEQLDADFAQGFRDWGVDVEGAPVDDASARLRAGSDAASLARALDDWGAVRRAQPRVPPAAWRRFHELALRVDADPQRSTVRRALLAGDRDELRRLADAPEFGDAPTDTLDLLASALAQSNHRDAAIDVWRRANRRHPESVRVIHSLAVQYFADAHCPPWDEVVRLFSAGTAVRPASAHLWTDLGYALVGQGDFAGAELALQHALELAPHDERALGSLVDLLRSEGRHADALARAAAAAERAPAAAGIWRVLGDARFQHGLVADAAAAYRRAVAADDAVAYEERLAQCLLELGQADEAADCWRRVAERLPMQASAHASLGLALRLQGKFDAAIAAFVRGSDDPTWAKHCDVWIDETERLAAALTLANGAGDAAGPEPSVVQASALMLAGRPLLAVRCYRAAFAADAAAADGKLLGWNRDQALLAAAAASAGAGDAAGLAPPARGQWHEQAVAWLREAIAAAGQAFDRGEAPANLRRRLAVWRHAPGLTSLLGDVQAPLAELEAKLDAGRPAVVVHAPFADDYTYRDLGGPSGVPRPFSGLVFDRNDSEVLIVGGHAQRLTASLFAVQVARDARGHVIGFAPARRIAAVPFADGGLAHGPQGALLYTRYPNAELGQLRPGDSTPDRVVKVPGKSCGGFAIVPAGLPGAGRAKLLAWPGGEWLDAELTADAQGVGLGALQQIATLGGGADGFVYVAAGTPCFLRPGVLVAEWSSHTIAAYDVDGNGDPIVETRRVAATGCRGVLGLAVDPVSGDVLVSTWRGDGTETIGSLQRTGR